MTEISGEPSAERPVTAATPTTAVISVPELVMNALAPLMTQVPLSSTARVRIDPGMSVPPPGSVKPKAAKDFPEASSGSQRCFCSSLPYR
ncbi:Uncharacterised protein [Mycobacteroides abscessus]|nr:Uncharacterised protein [Mycobacteroides abscessus]SIM81011.1 Uncharacterised protein [Mycobacteroides abscessus subsp. abscessus]